MNKIHNMKTKKLIFSIIIFMLIFTAIPISASTADEFEIKDGVLIRYSGSGGDVVIPDGLMEIGDWAFSRCNNLESVSLPDSIRYIGMGAFNRCYNLKSITIPSGVTTIGDAAFEDCESLTSLVIPSNVTTIGEFAFSNCISLESILIYANVTSIEAKTFYACKSVKSISIYSSTVKIIKGGAFSGCGKLTSISIPSSVTDIEEAAFYGCSSLKSITLPSSVNNIENNVFMGCDRNLIISGKTGSHAESYAKENKLKFMKIGEPLGDVLYSDIVAYINGEAIPTNALSGKTLIAVEDLSKYGFDVTWNANEKSLKVELNKNKEITPIPTKKEVTHKPGEFKCKYVYTNIRTYLSGEEAESFAIDGVTLIDFELLGKYGKLSWDDKKREIRLLIE